MLVDSHCHLDFPDFSAELDAVVARARAAGIGRMVTISTRVKKLPQILAITDQFPEIFCSVGTHPHNAHEELDVDAKALVALATHPKIVAIGEAGLDYHYDNSPRDAQAQSFRQHIAAARETGLPLVIHSRDCDADMTAILRRRKREGRLPGGPALLHRRPRSCVRRDRAWTLCLVHRNFDLQALGRSPGHCGCLAGRSHPGRNRCALPGAITVPRKTQ